MDSDKKDTPDKEAPKDEKAESLDSPSDSSENKQSASAPVDALSMTPEELEEAAAKDAADALDEEPEIKKVSPIKRFFRKVNVYLLGFVLIIIVVGAIAVVNYINSQQAPTAPEVASQELTEEALQQLANTDASVGSTNQTLTIQGNAIIAGQTLMRGNLNVAGDLQTGGSIQGPSLTISGTSNIATAQANTLQVADTFAVQGATTLSTLSVSGTSTLSGAVTANQLTVTNLILSGNASLQIPNHISFTGPTPSRSSINQGVLGNGGTALVSGSDTTGTVEINTGNNPTAGCFLEIGFAQAFSNRPHVLISPVGAAAGNLNYYVNRSTTGFSVCTNNAAAANQSFAFDYFITN